MVLVIYRDMLLSKSNINKTILYFKRNGFKNTLYAALERVEDKIGEKRKHPYSYVEPLPETLERQKNETFEYAPLISVLVPCYETKPVFLEDLILSLQDQTYQNFEIVLADASASHHVLRLAKELNDQYGNISYHHLEDNKGISDNTNAGLEFCKGEYIGLLDHDDLLTKDCLYKVVEALNTTGNANERPLFVFTDEDKTDTYLERYYEPNRKPGFNGELILTNNYICHFSVYKSEVINELRLRKEFDGAQDFDLVLRTISYIKEKRGDMWQKYIAHVPEVLYHWRCHQASTASNPESKNYAYENGLKAVQTYADSQGWKAVVTPLRHVGFYRVNYENIFESRKDIGVVGGPVYKNGKVSGGLMNKKGQVIFKGLRKGYSGYMHRAVLQQEAQVLDIRNMIIRDELIETFKAETGLGWPVNSEVLKNISEEEILKKSLKFCNKVTGSGIKLLYDPEVGDENES